MPAQSACKVVETREKLGFAESYELFPLACIIFGFYFFFSCEITLVSFFVRLCRFSPYTCSMWRKIFSLLLPKDVFVNPEEIKSGKEDDDIWTWTHTHSLTLVKVYYGRKEKNCKNKGFSFSEKNLQLNLKCKCSTLNTKKFLNEDKNKKAAWIFAPFLFYIWFYCVLLVKSFSQVFIIFFVSCTIKVIFLWGWLT